LDLFEVSLGYVIIITANINHILFASISRQNNTKINTKKHPRKGRLFFGENY
jgi:hypothetical protein